MRYHKCKKKGCKAKMSEGSPIYCPDHNELNKSAKLMGSLGGKASAAKLTPAERKKRATKASHARKPLKP